MAANRAPDRAGRSLRRRARSLITLLAVWLAVLLAVQVIVHARFRRKLTGGEPGVREPRKISDETGVPVEVVRAIGSYDGERRRRDLSSLPRSHPGTIRIGAFGDSFTFGNEVPPEQSFPALLAARFAAEGMGNVEIVNFGASWHGLAQQHHLWNRLGRQYELDFVLFGPSGLYPERDMTFAHGGESAPGYLHGRYVLDDDGGARFVDVVGETLAERMGAYFRLLPIRDYARFDRTPPAFLRSWLPTGKTIPNPFYYTRLDADRERDRLYRALAAQLSADDDMVWLSIQRWAQPLAASLSGHLAFAVLPPMVDFPLIREESHLSVSGNRLVADAYFEALTGERAAHLRWMTLTAPTEIVPAPSRPPLSRWRRAELLLGGKRVAAIVHKITENLHGDSAQTLVDFEAEGIASLLAIAAPGDHPLSYGLVPLRHPLPLDAPVILELVTDAGLERHPLGTIALLHPELELGVVRADQVVADANHFFGTPLVPSPRRITGGRVLVGDEPVARVALDPPRLLPMAGELVSAIASPVAVDLTALTDEGTIELVAVGGGGERRFAIGRFEQRARELPFAGRGLRRKIVRGGPAGGVVVNR